MNFSLYVHIPYCDSKCPYCDFNSYAVKQWPEQRYVAALKAELAFRSRQTAFAGRRLRTVFFGGGTPSLFAPASIGALLESADHLFGIQSGAEITLETNPGTVDRAKLGGYAQAGINRLSLGAQSFNPRLLKQLGRIHDAEQTRQAAKWTRQVGIAELSLDLIFALPGQTLAEARADIAAAVELEPDHISAYNLTFEPGTAFGAALKSGRMRPLAESRQAAMYEMVRRELNSRGYPMYEISNYARPGHPARHNLTYWRGEDYLGIGAGAHSYTAQGSGGRRWWNERLPALYLERALDAGIAEAGNETLDAQTSAGEFTFLNLRLREGLDGNRFCARFGHTLQEHYGSRLTRLIDGELLLWQGEHLRLSERGLELADSVFAELV
ncbi:MAG TPA: radical SAM family heme chaperone HemW [Candidatus Binataceae bacterium]|nr:radical SAM family heme chaperone HemW [Candidatus Binataceae bacterium]